MNSRSIDNYIHSIHTFQDFDTDDIFQAPFDPVNATRYNQHINHVFPNFTIRNCEACHASETDPNFVSYNAPGNSESMPGVASTSYAVETWYEMVPSSGFCSITDTQSCVEDGDCPGGETCESTIPGEIAVEAAGRNIFPTPEYVMGPAGRACGACHRSRFINQEEADALASFNSHVQTNGTLVENDPDDEVLFGVIDKIMSMFN